MIPITIKLCFSIVDEPVITSRKSKSSTRNTRTSNSNSIVVSFLMYNY